MPDVKAFLSEIEQVGLDTNAVSPFLAKVLQVVPTVIYIYNQKTKCVEFTNASLAAALGYQSEGLEDTGASIILEKCHPDDKDRVQAHFEALGHIKAGTVLQTEYRLQNKHGEWLWFESHDTIFESDADGSVLRHVGAIADINQHKTATERELLNLHAAQLANAELRSFAYAVSHDMKSPSNTLTLLLSELRDDHGALLNDDARNLVDLSQQTVERMKQLIEEILNYTRIVDKRVTEETVDLNPLMDKVLWDMRRSIAASGAKIDVGPLRSVVGNEPLLRTLFVNLVSNAIKFQEEGSAPNISIQDTTDKKSAMVSIAVIDDGIGLPEDTTERIFGMFNRLHTHDVYPGSGLGLSLCKRIAVNHGGDISAVSDHGHGATFTVMLRPA